MTPPTAARRRALRTLVEDEIATSQRELVEMLAARGFVVTQATVSRDLEELGAVPLLERRPELGRAPLGAHEPALVRVVPVNKRIDASAEIMCTARDA